MTKRLERLLVGDAEYTFKVLSSGDYTLCPTTALTDRFHRRYIVTGDDTGKPIRCSCPHQFYRNVVCKHVRAVMDWWMKNTISGAEYSAKLVEEAKRHGFE